MAKAEKALTPEELGALEERRRQEQARERAKRVREKIQMGGLWSRRDFFGRMSWGGFGILTGIGLLGFVRSAFPRVLFTPPSTFKAGLPSDYAIGEVSERFKKEHRVWIVRVPEGFYALFAKCTHLGCTPRWLPVEEKFKCPCHGSGYRKSGVNFEGPAPRPLERYRISLTEDGQLLVDMSVKYRYEKGDWDKPGAFLRV
ncbi:MAG TPA: Rieske 2Fe-2S domain-containing protein [Candidatus Binatia bacterium]|nr:Rieske 2Fe-2S domain-containing protein [Candidatus Binatia bacterium]